MTENSDSDRPPLDDPEELDRFLAAYRPSGLTAEQWAPLAVDAIPVVKQAGELTRQRVEKDLSTIGLVAAHLLQRGRPLTLAEVLADTNLVNFDLAQERAGAAAGTRRNRRGVLRRLQAVHGGLPWRRERRPDGARIADLPQPSIAAELARVEAAAASASTPDAADFLATVAAARRARQSPLVPEADGEPAVWRTARRFAAQHELDLTRRGLAAAVTYELLQRDEPIATLISSCGLTRRDMDLALTWVADLPDVPAAEARDALRG